MNVNLAGPPANATRNAESVEASLQRLNFPMPGEPADGDYPVIAALPLFLPIGPGQTFPHPLALADATSFRDQFFLFHVWKTGMHYCVNRNQGRSVTVGGPLFHLPGLAVADADDIPFEGYTVRDRIPANPTALVPTSGRFAEVVATINQWSDVIWTEIGSNMEPEPPQAGGGGGGVVFGPEQVRAVVEPLVNKEKEYRLADRSQARYRALLARAPIDGGPNPDVAVLPDLRAEFLTYLTQNSSAAASDDLKEIIRSKLAVANSSAMAINKDVTWESGNVTLAFSDRLRATVWLVEKLRATSLTAAKNCIGLLQFLTPDRDALASVVEGDLQVHSLVMANVSSNSAQIDASKSSKMYSAGRLETFRHSYEAFCNLRLVLSVIDDDPDSSMLIQKLKDYVDVLMDRDGRLFYETCREQPHLAVHPWQDLQHILSAFLVTATNADVYQAIMKGENVAMANYANAVAVADASIAELRAIINGNGLGKFGGLPCCADWFSRAEPSQPRTRGGGELVGSSGPKRQKVDPDEIERKKALGMLTYDTTVAGTTRLPNLPVYHKKKGAKSPECLCMKFLTRGYACTDKDCPFPHVGNVETLTPSNKTKFCEAVKKQPGLSWAEGKAPAGTTS